MKQKDSQKTKSDKTGDDRARKMHFFFVHFPSFHAHFLSTPQAPRGTKETLEEISEERRSAHVVCIHLCYSVVTH